MTYFGRHETDIQQGQFMELLKNLFSNTSNKAEAGSHQDITTISDIKDSTVKITDEKK